MTQPQAVLQASQNTASLGVNLSLHPLPILTISEHLTRSRVQSESSDRDVKVFGALLGTQSGRDIEIHNTFEIKVLHASSAPLIDGSGASSSGEAGPSRGPLVDHTFFKSRQAQYKQVFPTFEFVGWYSNGVEPTAADIEIHKQLLEYNEAPLFVQLSPTNAAMASSSGRGELPLQVYESQLEIATNTIAADGDAPADDSGAQLRFVPSSYRIQTGEAERIAVDYTSRPSGSSSTNDASGTIAALQTQQSAIRMLADRIQICHDYIASVRSGSRPPDHETLRRIEAVLAGMPAMNTSEFQREFLKEYNDVLLTDYLASMTQGLERLNELVDKFDVSVMADGPGDRIPGLDKMVGGGGAGGGGGGGGGGQRGTKGGRRAAGMGMA